MNRSFSVPSTPRSSKDKKSVSWKKQRPYDSMEISSITDQAIDDHPLSFRPQQDETQMNTTGTDDFLPLVADLMNKSTAVEKIKITAAEISEILCYFTSDVAEDSKPNIGENERQMALQELVTHLEDTAAMLRQYVAPPPADFMDHLSQSDKTNFLLKYQIVFVIFSQVTSTLVLTLLDYTEKQPGYIITGKVLGMALQLFNMGVVIFATVVLSRQMLRHKVVGSFLAQTYVATVITFAGLYFIIYRIQNDSWEFGSVDKMEESLAITQYIKMMYLSVSAATLCGAANIQPRAWYTVLILCFQSLINFVYFASILAQTIGNYNTYTVQVRRSASMTFGTRRRQGRN